MGKRSFSKPWGLRASVSFSPLLLPRHSLFVLSSQLSRRTRAETLATQAKGTLAGVSALYGVGDFTTDFIVIGNTLEEINRGLFCISMRDP